MPARAGSPVAHCLHKRAGFKVENRFMRARLALFRRVMKHHVTLE
ncbi:Putative esterase [Klebsiella pneumoniae IS53]|nr:Putative esterase [Klebsiella pneumoniae IS53]